MSLFQIISLCGSIFFLCLVIYTVYSDKLREAYALIWLLAGVVMIIFSVSSKLLSLFAKLLGIQTPAFALLLCLVMATILLLFQITIVMSEHNKKINRLLQEVALLREQLDRKK